MVEFNRSSRVRVRQLLRPLARFDGWRGNNRNLRPPRVGDLGIVADIRGVPGCGNYIVQSESSQPDGEPVWVIDFSAEEIEPLMAINTAWLTPDVIGLAQAIFDERAFERLPILADALEEAGCTNADILAHFRESGEHVWGCCLVDALLRDIPTMNSLRCEFNWHHRNFNLNVERSFEIERDRHERCLTHPGESFFNIAVLACLLGRKAEADELLEKSHRYLRLAYELDEKPKYENAGNFTRAYRAIALSYVHWLRTNTVDHEVLAAARDALARYCMRCRAFGRRSADLMTPALLYTDSYPLIIKIAERFSWQAVSNEGRKTPGFFFDALRVALSRDEPERQSLLGILRKKASKKMYEWIGHGQYDSAAYTLYALFPRPEGQPYRLIEGAWRFIPEPPKS